MLYKNYKKFYSNFILYTKPSFLIKSLFFYKGYNLPKKFYFYKLTSKNSLKPIFSRNNFFCPKVSYLSFCSKSLVFTKLNLTKFQDTLLNFELFLKMLGEPDFIILFNKVFRNFSVLSKNLLLKDFFVRQLSLLFIYKPFVHIIVLFSVLSKEKKFSNFNNT